MPLLKWRASVHDAQHATLQVVDDEELVAWWKEAREVGHADKPEGWISLTDIASLVQILATIAWIGWAS